MFTWFRNARMSSKLALIVLMGLGSMLVIGGYAHLTMQHMEARAHAIYEESTLPIVQVGRIRQALQDYREGILTYFVSDNYARVWLEDDLAEMSINVEAAIASYGDDALDDAARDEYKALVSTWEQLKVASDAGLAIARTGDVTEAQKFVFDGEVRMLYDAALDHLAAIQSIHQSRAQVFNEEVSHSEWRGQATMKGIIALSFVITLGASFAVARDLVQAIDRVKSTVTRVADGDLTKVRVINRRHDEVGLLTNAFNSTVDSITSLIRQMGNASDELTQSSDELLSTVDDLAAATDQIARTMDEVAQGTGEQSDHIQSMARSVAVLQQAVERIAHGAAKQTAETQEAVRVMNEIAEATQHATQEVEVLAAGARETLRIANDGGAIVRETIDGMGDMQRIAVESAERVGELGQHSRRIGEIVQVISDIADQTNLLALNAAIEAARAGEHGKGFAVVADEVRQLAERSATSAKEITELIKGMQTGVTDAVTAMNEGIDQVRHGTQTAEEASKALDQILTSTEDTHKNIDHIAEIARGNLEAVNRTVELIQGVAKLVDEGATSAQEAYEQSVAVTEAIEGVSAIAEETAAATEEVSATTEATTDSLRGVTGKADTLAGMARQLQEAVGQFRIE